VKKKRLHSCNVLDTTPIERHLWHFTVERDDVKLQREEVIAGVGKVGAIGRRAGPDASLDTGLDLLSAGERHPGDYVVVGIKVTRVGKNPGSSQTLAEARQLFRLRVLGFYLEPRGALLFVDPRGAQFANQDFERYLVERRRRGGPPIGVYLYDGAHDYRSQLLGLLLAVPHLAERALVVVDDANFAAGREATWDFLAACPQARLLLEVRTPGNGHPDFWNGLQVLTWERSGDYGYSTEELATHRDINFLRTLTPC
jgi:hypothetical protein